MITVQITEHTPANMLRAVRAACNELLGEEQTVLRVDLNTAESLKALALGQSMHGEVMRTVKDLLANVGGPTPMPTSGEANTAESLKAIAVGEAVMPVPGVDIPGPDDMHASPDAQIVSGVEVDSAGQPWDPEQHSSTRSKLQDGTWKKKRGAAKATERVEEDPDMQAMHEEIMRSDPPAPVPPTPPAPPAAEVVTMNQIWALIPAGKSDLDKVKAAAQAMGFADLGVLAQQATNEQRAALLAKLTEEVQA